MELPPLIHNSVLTVILLYPCFDAPETKPDCCGTNDRSEPYLHVSALTWQFAQLGFCSSPISKSIRHVRKKKKTSKPRDTYIFFSFCDTSSNQSSPAAWPPVWVFGACCWKGRSSALPQMLRKKEIGGSAVPLGDWRRRIPRGRVRGALIRRVEPTGFTVAHWNRLVVLVACGIVLLLLLKRSSLVFESTSN